MMRESLTDDEDRVLTIVQHQCRDGALVSTHAVEVLADHPVDRQLRSLASKGYVLQKWPGQWLPSPDLTPAQSQEASS
jgi:hypothetical protein